MRTQKILRKKGQVVIMTTLLFLVGSFITISSIASSVFKEAENINSILRSKQAFALSEGSLDDVTYRVMNGLSYSSVETLEIDGSVATTTVSDVVGGKIITSSGDNLDFIRKSEIILEEGAGVAFFYGIQTGVGGIELENNSSISGNVYAKGIVQGSGSNLIEGNVVSAGITGLIDGIHATGSVYAHVVQNSEVDGDAYFDSISDTTVLGSQFPNSPDQVGLELPISDEQITGWELSAEAGGIISSPCPYVIDSDQTIGPVKITCDVIVNKNSTEVTLMGEVWIEGNFTTKNSPTIRIDSSLGDKGVVIVADKQSDRITSSKIILENNAEFEGSGAEGSYVMLVSQNESAENGGEETAIVVKNNATGNLLVYARHGKILLRNNADLREVSGYTINLKNNAVVTYKTGLTNLLFNSGPAGGYTLISWREIK